MSGGVSKRVQANRKSGLDDGGFKKSGSGGMIGMPPMLRRFVARRAPDGIKNAVDDVKIGFEGTLKYTISTTPNNGNYDTRFGYALAWSSDGASLAVGAPFYDDPQNSDNDTGRVYIYQ